VEFKLGDFNCNLSASGKRKRKSPKTFNILSNSIKEKFPELFDWSSTPIYLRDYKFNIGSSDYDYVIDHCNATRIIDKKRRTYGSLKADIYAFANGEEDVTLQYQDVWRFLDASLKRDEELGVNETSDIMQELIELAQQNESQQVLAIQKDIHRVYHDPEYYSLTKKEALQSLKVSELNNGGKECFLTTAFSTYKHRDVCYSSNYVPNVLVQKLYNHIISSLEGYEKELVDWAESNLPNVTRKFISAILNQAKFISLNYLLPPATIITSGEKQKLFRYRKLILNKFYLTKTKGGWGRISSILNYNEDTINFINSIIPGYKDSGVSEIVGKIQNYKEKMNIDLEDENSSTRWLLETKALLEKEKELGNTALYETTKILYERMKKKYSEVSSSRIQLLGSCNELEKDIEERRHRFLLLENEYLT